MDITKNVTWIWHLKSALINCKYFRIYVCVQFCVPMPNTRLVIKLYVHCGIRWLDTVCSSPILIPKHQTTWLTSQKTITLPICKIWR
jgi:hypothetical protein